MNEAPFISLAIYNTATAATAPPPPPPPPPPTMSEPINDSPPAPPMFEPINYSNTAAVNGGHRRNKKPQPPLIIPSGCICFRLLCHASRISAVIGKHASIIKQLQKQTSAKIRVEDPVPDSDDRVISVVADCSVNRTMSFDEQTNLETNEYVESNEYTEVSAAQEALVRVYERILSVAAETDESYFASGGVVSCRLLTDTTLVGSVIGKGGKIIEKIKKDTGCKIRIRNRDKLPSCAMPNDELVEIEGDILAIKKALIATSRRLQDKPRTLFSKPQNRFPHKSTFSNGHTDFRPSRTLIREPPPATSSNHASRNRPFASMNTETSPFDHEVVFRILCSSERVGGVIGKSGTIVRALERESGACISVEDPFSDFDENVITITSMESPDSTNSPAQNGVILVFNRTIETGYEKGLDSPHARTPISAGLLISANQRGCLLGKNGSIIEDMRKVTGAFIQIVGGHHVPKCALENDYVVWMTGELLNVRDALYSVTSRLRNHLFSKGNSGKGNSHYHNQQSTLAQSMDNLGLSNNVDHPSSSSSSEPCQSQAGSGISINAQDFDTRSTSVKGGIELGRGGKSAIVRNSTIEIVVHENVIGSVYGENGSNLTRLRKISGAKVVVHEPSTGTSDYIVIISGTPNETQSAQSLLQAFILEDHQI